MCSGGRRRPWKHFGKDHLVSPVLRRHRTQRPVRPEPVCLAPSSVPGLGNRFPEGTAPTEPAKKAAVGLQARRPREAAPVLLTSGSVAGWGPGDGAAELSRRYPTAMGSHWGDPGPAGTGRAERRRWPRGGRRRGRTGARGAARRARADGQARSGTRRGRRGRGRRGPGAVLARGRHSGRGRRGPGPSPPGAAGPSGQGGGGGQGGGPGPPPAARRPPAYAPP